MDQLVPVLILLGVFLGILALMYLGWRGRGARQKHGSGGGKGREGDAHRFLPLASDR